MRQPRYIVERWPYGWLICSPDPAVRGIPMEAIAECTKLFTKKCVLDCGIAHHLEQTIRPGVVVCVVTPADGSKWRAEIEASIAHLPPEERWWKGLSVGSSSTALFAVMATHPHLKSAAKEKSKGSTPLDSDDFGRCLNLVNLFPGWIDRLPEVAAAYPDTKWPQIVQMWPELAKSTAPEQTAALHRLHSLK